MWAATVALWAFGGRMVIDPASTLHVGELTALMSYSTQVISSLTMVSFLIIGLSMTKVSLDRVNAVFDEKPDIASAKDGKRVLRGDVRRRECQRAGDRHAGEDLHAGSPCVRWRVAYAGTRAAAQAFRFRRKAANRPGRGRNPAARPA